ncbi:MAG: dihydropyrimidinase [Ignavibacteriales bacterium]|nr:dihydropyrimidinase [Ignavibacteriales bacterium]
MALLIKNGTIITAESVSQQDILIEDEKISRIEPNIYLDEVESIDAEGKYVIPGGVDVHTHLDMVLGNIVSRDDFETGTRAAAFGGTTTIIDYATQSRGMRMQNALELWHSKASGKSSIDYSFHMIVTELGNSFDEDIKYLMSEGVTSFKLFMAYPGSLMVDDETIFQALKISNEYGGLICLHAEDGNDIEARVKQALGAGNISPKYHALTRPPSTEAIAVKRAIDLAAKAEAPLYIVHVSSSDALKEIEEGKQMNFPVLGETCPQYLFLSTNDIDKPNFEGAKYVFTPPVREQNHQEALWEGLRLNTLDVVATDHCPFNFIGDKELGRDNFSKIPNGGPGIENRLHLLFEGGVNNRRISLNRWVDLVSTRPAKIFGLYPKKGTITVGSDADITIWDPTKKHRISSSTHHMRVDYNMYEGVEIRGDASVVLSRGKVIVADRTWRGSSNHGRFLARGVSDIR